MTSKERKEQPDKHRQSQKKRPILLPSKSQEKRDALNDANEQIINYNKKHPNSPLPTFNINTGRFVYAGNGSTIKARSPYNSKIKLPSPPYRPKKNLGKT